MKSFLKKILPRLAYERIAAPYRLRRANRSYAQSNRLAKKILARPGGDRVCGGPFAGLKLLPHAVGSALAPKLIGSYEAELHPIFDRIFRKPYTRVIDIGCAEGYYAVGLAVHLPLAEIWGFDLNPEALKASALLALHNAVHKRIRFGIECDHGQLNALCQNHTLVVCDIEGGEKDLLDPAFAPNLHFADLLIELHPIEGSTTILEQLSSRFESTHNCTIIPSQERQLNDYPGLLAQFTRVEAEIAFAEFRPRMHWGFWEARSNAM